MFKKIFSRKAVKIWLAVSVPVIVLFLVITIVANTALYSFLNIVMPGGGERVVYADGVDPIYITDVSGKDAARENGNAVNIDVCEEGFVLLKNENNALPLKTQESDKEVKSNPKISVFGKNSVNIAYGGSGSGSVNVDDAVDLYKSLDDAGYEVNPVLKNFYENDKLSGSKREANSNDLDSGETIVVATAETPQSKYTNDVKNSYANYADAALIVLTRIGGEGFDLPRKMSYNDSKGTTHLVEGARNADDHYLQLDKNETALLKAVCEQNFKRVIVIINSAAAMELTFLENSDYYAYQSKVDAAVWIGFTGVSGMDALGRILNGSINPSGRTVDTYATNLKDAPSYQNFGDNNQENGDKYSLSGKQSYYFVDYEESIYVGYRYYETRGFTDGEEWYKNNVVYPFGYGLSYTSFDWKLKDASSIQGKSIKQDEKYTVQIQVMNTGDCIGKEVVQLYGNAPYYENGIEKSYVVLLDFAKTDAIKPGESDTVYLTFDPYYLASYDYKDANKNGFRGYELEAGEYNLFVSSNAHKTEFKVPFNVSASIAFETDPVTDNAVENRYTDCENAYFNSDFHLNTLLSRTDWTGTMPIAPTEADRNADKALINAIEDMTHNNPYAEEYEELDLPDSEIDNGLTLRDMLKEDENGVLFADYEDDRWEKLIDQCSVAEMINLYNEGAFKSEKIDSIGKPRTNDTDGPAGFINFMDKTQSTFYGTCSYCAEVVMASTWNTALVEKLGEAVGNEGIWGNARGDKMPYSGWYAPAVNIHRSPFGGRNFEYFSEDGVLNGKMAAAEIKGCQSKGVYCFVKHFALNEQETHRALGGDISWVTEQAMREIYLKPFEIAVKDGKTRAMMSSFNRIGTRWTGGDYRLLTEILREEWGFRGMVISDFNTHPEYMDSRQMAYAGGDLNLATMPKSWCDESSVADVIVMRQCVKNILYTVVNSNAFNGEIVGTKMPYWSITVIVVDCLLFAGAAIWGVFAIRSALKKDEVKLQT